VPMPFRYSLFAETAVEMRQRGELGTISHMLFRFNQPGVSDTWISVAHGCSRKPMPAAAR